MDLALFETRSSKQPPTEYGAHNSVFLVDMYHVVVVSIAEKFRHWELSLLEGGGPRYDFLYLVLGLP